MTCYKHLLAKLVYQPSTPSAVHKRVHSKIRALSARLSSLHYTVLSPNKARGSCARAAAHPATDVVAHKTPRAVQIHSRATGPQMAKGSTPKSQSSSQSHLVVCAGLLGWGQHFKILGSTKSLRTATQRRGKATPQGLDVLHLKQSSHRK